MADTISKIKVNELETATPKLTDTLLASGDVKEYACKIEDLKEVIGGGGGDWNANEGDSGYIANRTHWVETGDSITGTFTLTQENIEDGEAGIQNSPLAEDVFNTFRGMSVLNVDVTINNQTYKADISYGNDKVYINSADGSFILDFSENEGIYNSYFEFNSSIFAAGENTVTIPVNTFHKIDPNYVEDTILWQKGSGMHAVRSVSGTASGNYSHAEGYHTTASGNDSHAEGINTTASGYNSHAEGSNTKTSGNASHAEGYSTDASGYFSHAEGEFTKAKHRSQHVFGRYNIEDPSSSDTNVYGTYIEIVGNGTMSNVRSNARTLDWNGNEWLKGSIAADGGLRLKSPDGSSFTIHVANDGTLSAIKNT